MSEYFNFSTSLWGARHKRVGVKPSFGFGPKSVFVTLYKMLSPETVETFRKVGSLFGQGPFWVAQRMLLEYYLYSVAYTNYRDGALKWSDFVFAFPDDVREGLGEPAYLGEGV